ncbi:hypothetical protein ACFU3K_38415, partial [Streptomyces shenzhenensis]
RARCGLQGAGRTASRVSPGTREEHVTRRLRITAESARDTRALGLRRDGNEQPRSEPNGALDRAGALRLRQLP